MRSMKGYIIVANDEGSIFGREDNEFFGAIWFYPTREMAEDHCGGAGRVAEIEVTFPDELTWSLASDGKVNADLRAKGERLTASMSGKCPKCNTSCCAFATQGGEFKCDFCGTVWGHIS